VSPQLGQGMSVEYLRELVQKRMITLTYIRNIHEGCVSCYWWGFWLRADPWVLVIDRVIGFTQFRYRGMNSPWLLTIMI
jgi:hypothetical protein